MSPFLVVKVDHARGLALVYGAQAKRVCALLSPVKPCWSRSGRGWVVPVSVVADLQAYAQSVHQFVNVSARKEAAA